MKSLILIAIVLMIGCGVFASDLDQAVAEGQAQQDQAYMNLQRFLGQTKVVMVAANTNNAIPAAASSNDGMVIRLKKIKKKSKA